MNSKKIKDIKIIAIIYIITIAILAVLVPAYYTGNPLTDKERDALFDSKSSSSLNKNTYIVYILPSSCKSFYETSMGDCFGCEFDPKSAGLQELDDISHRQKAVQIFVINGQIKLVLADHNEVSKLN